MPADVKPVPDGMHSLTPHLTVNDAAAAIAFYVKAFGAVEQARLPEPNGTRLMHAAVQIGDSIMMLNDTFSEFGARNALDLGGSAVTVHLYCEDVDAMVERAVAAGATVTMPPADMFWGDRYAQLTDPFGHKWSIATHVADPTPEEMAAGAKAAFEGGAG